MLPIGIALLLVSASAASPAPGSPLPGVAPPVATPAKLDDALQREQLGHADAMIRKGQQRQAIDQYLDPVIARYEAAYGHEKRTILAARSTAETMLYLVTAAGEQHDAMVIGPEWGDALYMKGFALIDLGDRAGARLVFEKAIALSPQNARYRSELGNIYQLERAWPQALATFQAAISAAAVSPEAVRMTELTRAMRGAGFALTELGRLDESEALYRKCVTLDPADKMAQAELLYIAGLRARGGKPVPTG